MSKQKRTSKIAETTDFVVWNYGLAKDIYLDELTDDSFPEKERIPKSVAKRLKISIEKVELYPFTFETKKDYGVNIKFKIRGNEKDIALVDQVLHRRGCLEQTFISRICNECSEKSEK